MPTETSIFRRILAQLRDFEKRLATLESQEWVGPTRGCRVYRNSTQSIPNATWTAVSYNTEIMDKGDCWVIATPTRLIAPRDGYYIITANFAFANGGSTVGSRGIRVLINGTDRAAIDIRPAHNADALNFLFIVTDMIYLLVGQYVEIGAYQSSGGAMNISAASKTNSFYNVATLRRVH